jgi:hypothetical protein
MIKAKGCSAREAGTQLHNMLLWLVLLLTDCSLYADA